MSLKQECQIRSDARGDKKLDDPLTARPLPREPEAPRYRWRYVAGSPRDWLAALNVFDRVTDYGEIAQLPKNKGTVVLDFTGNPNVLGLNPIFDLLWRDAPRDRYRAR